MPLSTLIPIITSGTTITAIGALFIALLRIGPERAKTRAQSDKIVTEAMEKITTSTITLLDPYEDQVERMAKKLIESSDQTDELTRKLREANKQAQQLQDDLDIATRKIARLQHELEQAHTTINDLTVQQGETT